MGVVTQLYECASCKSPLRFGNQYATVKACSCGTVNRKKDNDLLAESYEVISTADTVIQPGSKGEWNGQQFEVSGRMRLWFNENVFNYWTIIFADNTTAYLAEGYGLYAIYKALTPEITRDIKSPVHYKVNDPVRMDTLGAFYVQRVHTAWKFDVEGELWLPEVKVQVKVAELSAQDGRHAEIIQFNNETPFCFEVVYTDFAALNLQSVRTYNNPGHHFQCNKCKSDVHIKTYPYSQSCACNVCHSAFTVTEAQVKKLPNVFEELKPSIPVGSKGMLRGVEYEVMGFVMKQDFSVYQSSWVEYTLFNHTEGFAFLSVYNGHWIFLKEVCDAPVITNETIDNFVYNDTEYKLYNRYSSKAMAAGGEFMGNILNDGSITAREFIHPPVMWVREKSKQEGITYFKGEHVSKSELQKVFPFDLPDETGASVLDPRGFVPLGKIVSTGLWTMFVFLVVFALFSSTHSEKEILNKEVYFDSTDNVSFVTEKFKLDKWRSNLEFYISAPVSNDWFELNATLVNADNGNEYSFAQGVEYYYGYEDGSSWTEGSTDEKAYLDFIPAGNYFLQVQGIRPSLGINKVNYFRLLVKYDVPMWRNFFIFLGILILWPVIKYIAVNQVEKQRWQNSEFTPYKYED